MGLTRTYAERMDLTKAVPHPELASTGFCLANPGKEYLVFLPRGGEVTLDLSKAEKSMSTEWLRTSDGAVSSGEMAPGGARMTLKSPFPDAAVLYLWTQ